MTDRAHVDQAETTRVLVAFLWARFKEDEQVARKSAPGPWLSEDRKILDRQLDRVAVHADPKEAAHIVRWDPTRVLAEVKSKREILDLCEKTLFDDDDQPWFDDGWDSGKVTARHNLRSLAAPYADHPDYDPVWAVTDA